MGFFNFFSKEKKETLDKGLSKTKESVFSKIARAVAGKSKVDDEVLDNLEEVLITSDVGVETTLNIINRIGDLIYLFIKHSLLSLCRNWNFFKLRVRHNDAVIIACRNP